VLKLKRVVIDPCNFVLTGVLSSSQELNEQVQNTAQHRYDENLTNSFKVLILVGGHNSKKWLNYIILLHPISLGPGPWFVTHKINNWQVTY
jgi:hypothetical protein